MADAAISRIDAAISSEEDATADTFVETCSAVAAAAFACAEVSSDVDPSCADVADSSSDEDASVTDDSRMARIVSAVRSSELLSAAATWPTSSLLVRSSRTVRSPSATRFSAATALRSGREIERVMTHIRIAPSSQRHQPDQQNELGRERPRVRCRGVGLLGRAIGQRGHVVGRAASSGPRGRPTDPRRCRLPP